MGRKAVIFAAGLGTRLRPITDNIPKALAPVGDRTLLEICLSNLAKQGYDDIVINTHHFADKLIAEVERLRPLYPQLQMRISDESGQLMDTGGAIAFARPLLSDADCFLVHNVDIISNASLSDFHEKASSIIEESATDAVLLVYDAPSDRKLLFDENMFLCGWVDTARQLYKGPVAADSLDGKTDSSSRPLAEVAKSKGLKAYAFSGIHLLSKTVFDSMSDYGFTGAFPIMDFYLKAADFRRIRAIVSDDLRLLDVGTPQRLQAAADFITSTPR